jgi:tetratricopeptide (TPR) repeat protein/TolB-like protein
MSERDLPRDRIGPYRVERRLGRGGMGEVFLAFDERLERWVAVKRIRWHPGAAADAAERFRREAKAAARLNHPAIVQIHDLVTDEEGDAIVMEHVAGQSLAALLGGSALRPSLAVRLAREIADGLAHAHAAGFVHRDLKAENVMVTGASSAKILDFGLAKPLSKVMPDEESLTADGAVVGTCHAMSPEQAGGGEVDARSDLFSLGALLYEMLTGRSPFRGSNPLETLKRVLTETPPSLAVVRPDLPPALARLVQELLDKDPKARPRSAAEVALRLAEIEALPELRAASAGYEPLMEGMSGVSTDAFPLLPAAARHSPEPAAPTPGTPPVKTRSRRAVAAGAAAVFAVASLAGGLFYVQATRARSAAAPLRVVVPPPAVLAGSDERLNLVASGVLDAALGSLSGLQGIAVLDPRQLGSKTEPAKGVVAMARTAAADEVLTSSVEPAEGLARVTLSRLQGNDGRLLWTATFQVMSEPSELRSLAEAVNFHLRKGYPEQQARPGTPALQVRNEDYAAYLALQQRLAVGRTPADPEFARSEEIVRGSPSFLAGLLTAGGLARSLFLSTKEARYLDRAQALAQQAEKLAPGDPGPLTLGFWVAVSGGREGEPEAALARLEAALPGDPAIFRYRAALAEHRGRTEEALANFRAAAERVPSWRNLYDLANLEWRSGRIADAREHLGQLLERSPGNLWGVEALAKIELLNGDPERAGQLFADLVVREPSQRALWTQLGMARFFAGHYEEAIAAYRKALEIEPGHHVILLNLADTELALGRRREAEAHYRKTLARLLEIEATSRLQADDSMAKAQCLAFLGRAGEAAEIAQRTLQQNPETPTIVYSAALVYALVGDRTSALNNAKAALRMHLSPSWFRIAAFDTLRGDPELQSLLSARTLSQAQGWLPFGGLGGGGGGARLSISGSVGKSVMAPVGLTVNSTRMS